MQPLAVQQAVRGSRLLCQASGIFTRTFSTSKMVLIKVNCVNFTQVIFIHCLL